MARAEQPTPAPGGPTWKRLAAAGAVLLLAAAWLLAPLHAPRRAAPLRVVLVDASASVTRLRPGWEAWARRRLVAEAQAAKTAGEDLLALLYAGDVVVLAGPGPATVGALERSALQVSREGGLSSDLAAALASVERLSAGRRTAALRLLSDRRFTGRDPESALQRLEAHGAARAWVAPPPVELVDLALARLDLPDEVEPGAPLGARVWLAAQAPAESSALAYELELVVRAPSGERRWSVSGALDPAPGEPTAVALDLGPAERGTTRVAVRALLKAGAARGDGAPENDRAGGLVVAGDDLRIVVQAGTAAREAARSWAGEVAALPGLDLRLVDADELGGALADADVLVTYDADLAALPGQAVKGFVLGGGGWLALAGREAVSSWEHAPDVTSLAALEPDAGEEAARDVVILLDASGSMAGAPVDAARRAARELAAAAPRDERVVLRWFTDRLEAEVEVAGDPAALLVGREAGGATDVPAALASLADDYARVQGRKALALLVTDGRDQAADDAALDALRGRLRAAGVELAVFAVGEQADLGFLSRLVASEGRLRVAEDPRRLQELFEREAAGARLRTRGPYLSSFGADAGAPLAREAASPDALGGAGLPPIEAYVRARARPDAVVAWIAGEGEPLLGLARRGLGATAVFGSLPGRLADGWAPQWGARQLAPLLRWLGRGRPPSRARLALQSGVLTLEGSPPGWPAELLARAGSRETRLVAGGSPLVDPGQVRSGPWPWEAPRGETISLHAPGDPAGAALATLFLAPGAPEELAWEARRVAAGSPPGEDPAGGPQGRPPGRGGHPAGPIVLLLGLLLVAGAGLAWGRR